MNVALNLRNLWSDLVVDPSDQGFLDQVVSLQVPDAPSPSVVRDHVWLFPWDVVAGISENKRKIIFDVPCGDGRLTDDKYKHFLLFCKLYALLKMAKPENRFVDLSTIRGYLRVLFALVDEIANTSFMEGRTKLAEQTADDLDACISSISKGWRPGSHTFSTISVVMNDLLRFGDKKLLPDWPRQVSRPQIRRWCGGEQRTPHKPQQSDRKTAPLPLIYCARSLVIADFYLDVLADPIIARAGVAAEYRRQQVALGPNAFTLAEGDPRRGDVRYAAWCKANPWPVTTLPFPVKEAFLNDSMRGLYLALVGLQSSAMQTIALPLALRSSEFLLMERGCLGPSRTTAEGARISTLRHKGAPHLHSEPIEWDVPDWVSRCIDVQLRLGDALHAPAVWHNLFPKYWGGRLKSDPEFNLKIFADQHFLDPSEGDSESVTLQRFRPTIAREVITSPVGHIRILQRLLGHRDIQTTVNYMRMNPYLSSDLMGARHRKIGENPPIDPGVRLQVHDVEGDIPVSALGELISETERIGNSLRLLAPGILVPMSDEGGDIISNAFGSDAVRRDALLFAIRNLCRRQVRASSIVHDWFMQEAIRHCRALAGAPGLEPEDIGEAAVLDIVRGRV